MLDDMPKGHSAALVARAEGLHAARLRGQKKLAAAKTQPKRRWRREKVVKQSALGMVLKPIGISLALVLSAYALLSLGTTFWRSYHRHLDQTAAVHADKSILDIFFGNSSLPRIPSTSWSRMWTGACTKWWRASPRPTTSSTTPS